MFRDIFRKIARIFRQYGKFIVTWLIIIVFVSVGLYFGLDKKVITLFAVLFGILGNAFAGLAAIVATVPIIGPIIIKVLTLPIFWLLNALGYFVSVLAIKKGYGKQVVNYRMVTVIFLIGIIVGFIFGKIF